jgi:predicted HTH transcriptional regulator
MNPVTLDIDTFLRYYRYGREDDAWDYKQDIAISHKSEFAELAKDLLAFANYGGGFILIGIEDGTNVLTGVKTEIDPSNLGTSIEKKLGLHLDVRVLYFGHAVDNQRVRLGLLHVSAGHDVLMSTRDLHKSDGSQVVQVYCSPLVRRCS